MIKEYALLQSEEIKGENLRMKIFNCSMMKMLFLIIFQLLEHQQNEIVERKNISLQEMANIMLNDNLTPKHFQAKAMNTTTKFI